MATLRELDPPSPGELVGVDFRQGFVCGRDPAPPPCFDASELGGANAGALERILVDRILACHVAVLYFDSHEAQNPGGQNAKLDEYRMKRQDQAHGQFLSAAKTLAIVRQLAAKTIQVELIQRPPVKVPVTPICRARTARTPACVAARLTAERTPSTAIIGSTATGWRAA